MGSLRVAVAWNPWSGERAIAADFRCGRARLGRGRRSRSRRCASAMADAKEAAKAESVVVCGAGVIGACTAYFLAQKGVRVKVVEKCSVACAASGKAGGFLALDWCDSGPVGKLARASFRLHEQLAEELGGAESYGYRRVGALSVSIQESRSSGTSSSSLPAWVDGPVAGKVGVIGTPETTAQVHPQLFTRKVLDTAVEKFGAELVFGEVKEIKLHHGQTSGSDSSSNARVAGVVITARDGQESFLAADGVVLAMGPWSGKMELVSRLTTISGLKAHSVVLFPQQPDAISAHCLFLGYKTKEGRTLEPEIYPRGTGEVYVCGMSEEIAVPDDPDLIRPKPESLQMLHRVAATVSSKLAGAEVVVEQACFLPCSQDGLPLIGKIPGADGVFVGTGHSCWGILNGPATGASLSELIAGGAAETVDLAPFDPARFSRSSRRKPSFAL